MYRLTLAIVALIALAPPASADDRRFMVNNFDRVRVDGPFEVRVTVGGSSASARAEGDARFIAALDLTVQGTTLIVRKGTGTWTTPPKSDGGATPIVYVVMPALRGGTVVGGGKLAVAGKVQSPRLDFQVTGAGSIDVKGIDADDTNVTLIGSGAAALAGRSGHARLLTNGNGTIAAGGLDAGDLFVRLDGPGSTAASARYTADVTTTGLGAITVAGNPKCRAVAPAGGPISCGQ